MNNLFSHSPPNFVTSYDAWAFEQPYYYASSLLCASPYFLSRRGWACESNTLPTYDAVSSILSFIPRPFEKGLGMWLRNPLKQCSVHACTVLAFQNRMWLYILSATQATREHLALLVPFAFRGGDITRGPQIASDMSLLAGPYR